MITQMLGLLDSHLTLSLGYMFRMDDPEPLGKYETGSKTALPIFENFIKKDQKSDARPFKVAENITMMIVDPISGKKSDFIQRYYY